MKLILIVALLSITLANSFLFRVPNDVKPTSDSAPSCVSDYFTAFFAHFGLDQPNQLLNCFDDKSAALFFKHLYGVTKLVQDAENRNRVSVHLDFLKLVVLDKGLEHVHACVAQTQDFTDLLNALGAEERNPELFGLAKYIYYQANFGKLAQELPQVTGAIDNKDFKDAGDLAASVVNVTVNEIKSQGLALLALNGVWNGVHIALGLPDAESVVSCWNNDTAGIRLEFIYGLSVAVANGSANDAAANTENWYDQTGKDLVNKIPDSAWKCWANSTDTENESAKLKIDITSQQFYSRVSKFVQTNPKFYWGLQKAIKSNLEQHNFIHAGSAYGHLLQAAAATN